MIPIEKQVCSLELATKLKELSVKQESVWYWGWGEKMDGTPLVDNGWLTLEEDRFEGGVYNASAFTVAELGEMLPEYVEGYPLECSRDQGKWFVEFDCIHCEEADTEANARAKVLIWLIENGHVNILKLNYGPDYGDPNVPSPV